MKILLIGVLVAGCMRQGIDKPGEPNIFLASSWIQGEPTEATVHWDYPCKGTGDWGCPSSTITVMRVTCSGCSVLDDSVGKASYNGVVIRAVATTDGPITLDVTVRFDDTDEMRQVSGSTTGDHEVALEAECRVIDTTTLNQHYPMHSVPNEQFRACEATRLASDTAVLFPVIRTFHGNVRFPFCLGSYPCAGSNGEPWRLLSSLSLTPAPVDWGTSDWFDLEVFALLPPLGTDQRMSLRTPLVDGTISTVSVAIPPVL
jgi:hypothetical protein